MATRHLIEEGVVTSFYVGKLQYHSHLRVPSSLGLSIILQIDNSLFELSVIKNGLFFRLI